MGISHFGCRDLVGVPGSALGYFWNQSNQVSSLTDPLHLTPINSLGIQSPSAAPDATGGDAPDSSNNNTPRQGAQRAGACVGYQFVGQRWGGRGGPIDICPAL